MKKTLLLTLAAGLVGTTPLLAADLYITGSTAFRSNVHDACYKLFVPGTIVTNYDLVKAIGGDGTSTKNNPVWTFSGTPITTLSNGPASLTIHANFTGSVQGMQTVENSIKLLFLRGGDNTTLVTNSPTIAFSDVASSSTPYPATGNFSEESVAVQPFVMVKSLPTNNAAMNSITSITYDQLKSMIVPGRLPLSAWSNKNSDHTNYVYFLNRTKDSGTRRTTFAMENYGFSVGVILYNWDPTNANFYLANNLSNTAAGYTNYGVVGAAGNNNANLDSKWGAGYVGGGDIRTAIGNRNTNNQSISYLSFADARTTTATNWSNVIPINGLWPTAAGSGVIGNIGTNDFSPITTGLYPHWAEEVVVFPVVDPSSVSTDQNLTAGQLGNQTSPGTILGVLDYQTKYSAGTAPLGSLEFEIISSQTNSPAATAIRLIDMTSSRASVGGGITP